MMMRKDGGGTLKNKGGRLNEEDQKSVRRPLLNDLDGVA
jgi:hypothetical protein